MVADSSFNLPAGSGAGRDRSPTGRWLAAAFFPALLIAAGLVALNGGSRDAVAAALKATARWSYLWFWGAYAGGALAVIFGARFQALARRGRTLGLAFAAAQTVHAALVLSLYVGPFEPPGTRTLAIFGPALALMYLIAALSFTRIAAPIPPAAVRTLRLVAVEYIAFVFLLDFAKNPLSGGWFQLLAYLPFQGLVLAGVGLRVAAYARQRAAPRASAAG